MDPTQIVDVIPITRGALFEHLSYFTTKPVAPGAIVGIPLRKRLVSGLVVKTRPAAELKLVIKTADFDLKKIERVKRRQLFTPAFLAAVYRTADYFAGPAGPVLKSSIPQIILDQHAEVAETANPAAELKPPSEHLEQFVTQDLDGERLAFYRGLIREAFAKNASVFICQPTVAEAEDTLGSLEKGIQEYTFIFHHRLPKRQLLKNWNEALQSPHPVVIIGTPLFLSLPRLDLRTLIIDHESSPHYKASSRPFGDARILAEWLARFNHWRLIRGDTVLGTETAHRAGQGDYLPAAAVKQRFISEAVNKIIRVAGSEILSEELAEALKTAHHDDERIFILSGRRGLSPLIICKDCENPVVCEQCQMPIALHQSPRADKNGAPVNILICHRCGRARKASDACQICGGWRLKELGVGGDKIAEALNRLLPSASVWRLDSDHVKTPTQARTMVRRFLAAPGGLLLGTEMALYYLKDKIETVVTTGLDSLLLLPEFRIRERLFASLIRARALASKRFLLQTRRGDETLFQQAVKGNLLDFQREEIAARRQFDYPPFRVLIKVNRAGAKDAVTEEMGRLAGRLENYQPIVFPALEPEQKGKYQLNLIMKISPGDWPDPVLAEILRSLPLGFVVVVNPEHIF